MLRLAAALLTVALAACSSVYVPLAGSVPSGDSGKLRDQHPKEPSPEEDPEAPGQIPQECETLLNRSKEWGYTPGLAKWRPKTREDAFAAAGFFSGFHLVPQSTSNFAAAWMKEDKPATPAAAEKSISRMDRAQSCDMVLAHGMLLSLLDYRWNKAEKASVGRSLLEFVRAQQERVSPSMARAIQLSVLAKAVRKGFVRANATEIAGLQKWYDEETRKGLSRAEVAEDPIERWKIGQDELKISEEARARIAHVLPIL